MDSYTEVFDLLIVISGIYMIFWGFSGKSNLFKTDNIKDGYEKRYKMIMKWFCLIGGAIAIVLGALDHFKIEPFATILFYVLCGIVVVAFVVLFFFIDKEKAKRNGQQQRH